VASTSVGDDQVVFVAADGARVVCSPPFPPLLPQARGSRPGFDPLSLLEHVSRERVVGVLLARLGGHAAGVFEGSRLVDSKVGSRVVHGRHRKGGSSSGRFARRREGQARAALEQAGDVAARVLLPRARPPDAAAGGSDAAARGVRPLDAVVLGGDRRALEIVLADPRLAALRPLIAERVHDVPDPRLAVLRSMPERFTATIVQPSGRISR
jgi:Actinobacteria/chloroflexi VLRF1 release factor